MSVLVAFLICAVIGLSAWIVRLRGIIRSMQRELGCYREVEAQKEKVRCDLGPPLITNEAGQALSVGEIREYIERVDGAVGLFGVTGGFRNQAATADFSSSVFGPGGYGLRPYLFNVNHLHRMCIFENSAGRYFHDVYMRNGKKTGPEHKYGTVAVMCNSIVLITFTVHHGSRGSHIAFTITVMYTQAQGTKNLLSGDEIPAILPRIPTLHLA